MNYKKAHPDFGISNSHLYNVILEQRRSESERIRERYPDRIPVICEKSETSKLPDIDKTKYLVPSDLTAYHFNYIIRKRIKLPEKDSLYFFVNGKYLLKGDTLMAHAYEKRKDNDGFLYITYTDETTLGAELQ
ncbi:autophagy-related protein 8f [Stylonychia lemnae]|uniref:Autophagy-related protein n=1 Tax=Stylonychia lemnae TaxID=5949 RepID=A0A077ZRU3_STYLE|nr:autophagy-related protein 8f [Stylonychia lemnae]|eukprot:CDW72592.1 autophagy-related protein 8f [Stylonychia lemnae]